MTRAEEFGQRRPLLFSIAYRILGSVSEAEDAHNPHRHRRVLPSRRAVANHKRKGPPC
jgi:hypothetical protein